MLLIAIAVVAGSFEREAFDPAHDGRHGQPGPWLGPSLAAVGTLGQPTVRTGVLPDVHEQAVVGQFDYLVLIAALLPRDELAALPGAPVIVGDDGEVRKGRLPHRHDQAALASLNGTARAGHASTPAFVVHVARHGGQVKRLRPGLATVITPAGEGLHIVSAGPRCVGVATRARSQIKDPQPSIPPIHNGCRVGRGPEFTRVFQHRYGRPRSPAVRAAFVNQVDLLLAEARVRRVVLSGLSEGDQ